MSAQNRPPESATSGPFPQVSEQWMAAPEVVAIADNFLQLTRSFNRIRAQFLVAARHNIEWSAQVLISVLAAEGPMRAGALAEAVQSDPSTVSRQIAPLIKAGFVERRPDQHDGRATVLAATEQGEEVHRAHRRLRYARYERILEDWKPDESAQFAAYLQRFTRDLERGRADWCDIARGRGPAITDTSEEGAPS